ncbi:MAG: methylmalonyl-CoA epimerase [Dehalococcoidia bacterium]|jgi:methylmalonyl-CoA epimerase|nr:methylmalonyl-CoA epimerase [Dehalococcoidia bacterium]MDP6510705.1 methylmalonyl-CoA epimerase [Dehalococcoidia bacterium]MDP7239999.1 methylmalonyl-CoA epimerase [Dehalococcoidia bacterium]
MLKDIHHVALVVKSIDESLPFFEKALGLKGGEVVTMPEQGVKAVLLPMGQSEIELIEPIDENSGVGKFLANKGEGIHHICLEVDDVDRELVELGERGVQAIDKQGRKGLAGKVAFLHPKSTQGVLIELAQKQH